MSQIPPPPPPTPTLFGRKDETGVFVSSLEHATVDGEMIVHEIQSLGRQEWLINSAHVGYKSSPTGDGQGHDGEDGKMLIISSILQPILQNGPICGLAALAMAVQAEMKKRSGEVDGEVPSRIFQEAVSRGFTKRGEMFSADNMASLARTFLQNVQLVNTMEMSEAEIRSMIVTNSLKGNYFLVPYDADRNHRPGLFRGHKAHWCVVTGFAVWLGPSHWNKISLPPENAREEVVFLEPETLIEKEQALITGALITNADGLRLSVLARQSKSKYVGLWPLEALVASNRNLSEIAPKILADANDYILHPIASTLKDRIILIN